MRLPAWFRRTRPTPAPELPRMSHREVTIYRWHNLTEAQWTALTDPERAQHRHAYMKVTMP